MIDLIALLCVIGIACGQILFKLSATLMARDGLWAPSPLLVLLAALVLYGVTTLAWVWVLKNAELGKIYPLMALAFVLVPLASYFVFGERFDLRYGLGVVFILLGIVLTTGVRR